MHLSDMVEVKRSKQTTYTYLPKRWCTYCGHQGIYEDNHDDYYTGCGIHCFRCSSPELNNAESYSKLLAAEPVVVDRKEWTEQVKRAQYEMDCELEQMLKNFSRFTSLCLYGDGEPK